MTLSLPLVEKPVLCAKCIMSTQAYLHGIDYELAYKLGVPCSECGEKP